MSAPHSSGDSSTDSSGVRCMVLSAAGFSVMALFVKLAGERLPVQEIVLARAVAGLGLTWLLLARKGVSPWGQARGLLVVRGLLGLAGLFSFFYAVKHLPLAEATVIHYLNPVLTALFAAALIGERLHPLVLVSAASCVTGVALIQRPAFLFGEQASALDPVAVLVAFGGAVFSSLAYIVVRRLSRTEDPLVIVFYFPLVALPVTIPTVVPVAVWPTPMEWLFLAGVGVFTQVGQVFLTKGLKQLPAGRAMTIAYVQVLFAAILGFLFFGATPTWGTAAGALLILAGIVCVAAGTNPAGVRTAFRAVGEVAPAAPGRSNATDRLTLETRREPCDRSGPRSS